jgi:hypothetical protein
VTEAAIAGAAEKRRKKIAPRMRGFFIALV